MVARPDERWGETVCAFVTPREGAGDLTEEEIMAWCRERIARFKTPRTVVFGPLPKTVDGEGAEVHAARAGEGALSLCGMAAGSKLRSGRDARWLRLVTFDHVRHEVWTWHGSSA